MDIFFTVIFTLFTFPGIIVVVLVLVFLWWHAFFVVQPRRYQPVADHYDTEPRNKKSVSGCVVSFSFGAHRYGIRRTGSGGMEANPVRVTNWLIVEVSTAKRFFIGNEHLTEYFFDFNLGSGSERLRVDFLGQTYLIGSDQNELTSELHQLIEADQRLQTDLKVLFEKPWAHLRVKTERNIGRGVVTKLEYVGFPHTIADRPEELRPYLEAIERLCLALKM